MRNLFIGTGVDRNSKKRHAERTRETQENQQVGRSRRQRDMDDAYIERREKMKVEMMRKQQEDACDVNYIGRRKGLILIETTSSVPTEKTETKNEVQAILKTELPSEEETPKPPEVVPPLDAVAVEADTIYLTLLKGLTTTNSKKFIMSVQMVNRLIGSEGKGWVSTKSSDQLVHLIVTVLMSCHLSDVRSGGDARRSINSSILKPLNSKLNDGKLTISCGSSDEFELKLDDVQLSYLNLARLRAEIIVDSYNDDSLIVQGAISKLEDLLDHHHKLRVLELVREGELNAYEAIAMASATTFAEADAVAVASASDDRCFRCGTETEFRATVIEQSLEQLFDLHKTTWAKRSISLLFRSAYHMRDDFNKVCKQRIESWQSAIKSAEMNPTPISCPTENVAGKASFAVADARVERTTYTSASQTWANKQKGVL
eukprot:GHVH01004592.1.p1 GENE.GHVH01004592.1~~GHVH01004592.1.p1  ORF type:complete len:430 (-),score=49.68 GHVH01004592.1:760-2049(-)